MKACDFVIVGKFAINKVNYNKFKELLEMAINKNLDKEYIKEKWDMFQGNMLSFLVIYKEFTEEIIKEIKKINYKG